MKKFLKIFLLTCFLLGASNIYFAFATGGRTATTTPRKLLYDAGTSLSFGVGKKVDTPAMEINRISFSTTSFSFSAWIRPNALSTDSFTRLLNKAGNDTIRIRLGTDNRVTFTLDPNAGSPAFSDLSGSGYKFKIGEWAHVACVYDKDAGMFLYKNGVLVASNTTKFTGTTGDVANLKLTIGADGGGNAPFNGLMDSVRVWYGKALSNTEITNLYYNNIVPRDNLIGEWLFNEGSGTTALDTSGNGNNGTITGATYSADVNSYLRSDVASRTLIE